MPQREAGSAGLGVVEGPMSVSDARPQPLRGSVGWVVGTERKRGACSWNWNRSRRVCPNCMAGSSRVAMKACNVVIILLIWAVKSIEYVLYVVDLVGEICLEKILIIVETNLSSI